MSDDAQPNKMAEIAGLSATVADRILALHEAGTSIPPDLFRMLVRTARLLLDNRVPWPPSVEHVVMEVAKRIEEAKLAPADTKAQTKGDDVVGHLTQALNAAKLRRENAPGDPT